MTTISKKICMLGEFSVGKTSLVKRFVFDKFDDKYISSIGVKVSRKSVVVPRGGETVHLNMMHGIWLAPKNSIKCAPATHAARRVQFSSAT